MFPTATYPIEANRYVPHEDYVDVIGYDFSGATLKMQVRDTANNGPLRADIVPTVTVTTSGGIPTTRISWVIGETTMEAMPTDPTDPAKDVTLRYDVHVTPVGEDKFVPFRGTFVVKAGVTQ